MASKAQTSSNKASTSAGSPPRPLFADEAVRQHKLAAADTWVHREQTEAAIAASAYKDEALAAALASRDRQRRAGALDELLPGLHPITKFQHQILLQTDHQRDHVKPMSAEFDRRERAAAATRWQQVRDLNAAEAIAEAKIAALTREVLLASARTGAGVAWDIY